MTGSGWVQVLGRLAVHRSNGEARRLTGSAQKLVSALVAAGPSGTSAERIAEAMWGDHQPNPWRPALRMAVARLRKQLPEGWDVLSETGGYRIAIDRDGWIDAWRLDELSSSSSDIAEPDLVWALAGEPFADVDLPELVGASAEHLRLLQTSVAERFCEQGPTSATTATCSALNTLLRSHPYNEQLASVVARGLTHAGRRSEALEAVASFTAVYREEFDTVPQELAEFLATSVVDEPPPRRVSSPRPTEAAVPKELVHLLAGPFLGRAEVVEQLRSSTGALIAGPTGAGKSRLLAELISTDPERETTYVVGDDRIDLALGPFAVAIPALRDELAPNADIGTSPSIDDGAAERAAATRAWRTVLGHFEERAASKPQRLVVDDAHLLDAASLSLLRLLIRSNTAAALTLTICGRDDFDDATWNDFVRDAPRAGLDVVEVVGLEPSSVEGLVYEHFPTATREARRGLADDVLEACGGLPAVAVPLIAAADPETLALPDQLSQGSALHRVLVGLDADAQIIRAAAAVLGQTFSVGELIALTGLEEEAVFGCLDELWARGLIVETDDPDQVRFQHLLVRQALLEDVPLYRRAQLHRRAAESTQNVHERADHQARSGTLIASEIAIGSLVESASVFAKSRKWRRVAHELHRADEIADSPLDAAALALWAEALDRSGADGSQRRSDAFKSASESQDWPVAVRAALSGLPEAERPDGDAERVAMLEAIPADLLPAELRFDLMYHLGRQHTILGNADLGAMYADRSLALAQNADEVGLSHVNQWTSRRHIHPVPYQFPEEVLYQGGLAVRTRVAQMSAIGLAERGKFVASKNEAARFDGLAARLGDPLRIWQSMILGSMPLLNAGQFQDFERVSGEALEFAGLHGLGQGTSVWAGQMVHAYHLQDRLHELWPLVESYRSNLLQSTLSSSAALVCQVAAGGDGPDPAEELRRLLLGALERPRAHSVLILTSLAHMVRPLAPELATRSREYLKPFAESSILVGFGGANIGPVLRYVTMLTSDDGERQDLARRCVALADEHGPLLWRVLSRIELGEMGDPSLVDEASGLAVGTELAPIVGRRVAQLG